LDNAYTPGCEKWRRTCSAHDPRSNCAPQRPVRAILAIVATLALGCFSEAQTPATAEYELKAAFLFHFAQFVEWPEAAFKDAGSPLTYCTIGDDPFRGSLDEALNGKTLGARSFKVMHLKQPQEVHGCQVLFVGGTEKKFLAGIIAKLQGDSVLTVGESEHFAQDGGTIGFCLEGNKIRFEINLEAAEKAKLKISSKLLALAKTVIGSQGGA
jgi:YfiR/HmsC-like